MGNRVSYPIHIKEMAIQMKKENIPVKTIMEELGIKKKHKLKHGGVGTVMVRIIDWFNRLENNIRMEKGQKINPRNNSLKMKINF